MEALPGSSAARNNGLDIMNICIYESLDTNDTLMTFCVHNAFICQFH